MSEKNNEDLKDGDKGIYEVGYHILPTLSEADVASEVGKIQNLITGSEGSIITESFPELRGLAYEISKRVETKYNKFNKAYFGWVKFEIERGLIGKIESALKSDPNILRFLVIKTIRENTLYVPKMVSMKREVSSDEPLVSNMTEKIEKKPVSEEELDKSIDELVVS